MGDPFTQALHDYHFGEQDRPLRYRNGEQTKKADIDMYFQEFQLDEDSWLSSWLSGPLLDMGAGVGRHALALQERFETVAVEKSELLVETMRDRGVTDPRKADMFALREAFERDRFESALAVGTQLSLARSMDGLRQFLCDLASVTTPDGTAVVDGFDPSHEHTKEMLDYYDDPTNGLAYRVLQFEYDGMLGEPWLYRLYTPERVREATIGTGWEVADVNYGAGEWAHNYQIALQKR